MAQQYVGKLNREMRDVAVWIEAVGNSIVSVGSIKGYPVVGIRAYDGSRVTAGDIIYQA
ncbi:MAG: hypothetical protein HYT73_00930 [Candidatus Aenigmarchaeota archaeon]|nr:hypothetical protein [Candidatus Aenigmarchaeota archaeon]